MTHTPIVLVLACLGAGCGGARPGAVAIPATHLSQTLGTTGPDLAGTWQAAGSFFGLPADGQTVTFTKDGSYASDDRDHALVPARTYHVERKDKAGAVIATGVAIGDGADKFYVAWSNAAPGPDRGPPIDLRLAVYRFDAAGFQGVIEPRDMPVTGHYAKDPAPTQLAENVEAYYPGTARELVASGVSNVELHLARVGKTFYTKIMDADTGYGYAGTAMLSGGTLVGVHITQHENILPTTPEIGVGIYTIRADTVSGRIAWMVTAAPDWIRTEAKPVEAEGLTRGAAAPASPAEPTHLELAELKVVDVTKNEVVVIHADGTIEANGKPVAKVGADGKIIASDTGEVSFTLLSDGSVIGANNHALGIKIDAGGVLRSSTSTFTIDESGRLVGTPPGSPEVRIEGASTPALKRTAMFVLMALN